MYPMMSGMAAAGDMLDEDNGSSVDPPAEGTETDPPPDYPFYFDMPNWSDVPPPPTYQDAVILGMNDPAYPPGFDQAQRPDRVTSLGYVDFLPRMVAPKIGDGEPTFEEFKVVMTMSNNWLQNYPQYRVLRCESIERRVNPDGTVETETTVQHTSGGGVNAYVRGLRMWLATKTDGSPPQKIWYMNVMPKPIARKVLIGRGHRFGHSYSMTMSKATIYPDFENLDQTTNELNKKLKENPVPGSILNMESIDMKYSTNFWAVNQYNPNRKPYNPDKGYWGEAKSKGILYLTVLRLFFVQGPTQQVEVGFEDFVPYCVKNITNGKPVFEKMTEVVPRVNQWLNANLDKRVTNMNVIQTKVSTSFFSGTDNVRTNTKCTYYSDFSDVTYVNAIRVAYIKSSKAALQGVSCKSFVPVRYGGDPKNSESLKDVMSRINTWLAVTGADVMSADTVLYMFNPLANVRIDPEITTTHTSPHKGYHWMTVIQLYINGSYTEPPPEILPPTPHYVSSSCCNIL